VHIVSLGSSVDRSDKAKACAFLMPPARNGGECRRQRRRIPPALICDGIRLEFEQRHRHHPPAPISFRAPRPGAAFLGSLPGHVEANRLGSRTVVALFVPEAQIQHSAPDVVPDMTEPPGKFFSIGPFPSSVQTAAVQFMYAGTCSPALALITRALAVQDMYKIQQRALLPQFRGYL